MISRNHRFHGHNGLKHVYQNGLMVRGPHFALKYILNPRRRDYRLAVVVSRKVEKSAVGRNRMRRRLYETVRLVEADITEPYDMVLTVFSNALLDESPASMTKELNAQLKTAGILAKKTTPDKQ